MKKKVLILGCRGMLGNCLFKLLEQKPFVEVLGTTIENKLKDNEISFNANKIEDLEKILDKYKPDWIVNCIADTSSVPTDVSNYFFINSIFPQLLDVFSKKYSYRFIHISSNGVFDHSSLPRLDSDLPDSTSLYGISKTLGERLLNLSFIIRTSIIGISQENKGLINWLLGQKGNKVNGYTNVSWNGVTTLTLSKVISRIIENDIKFNQKIVHIAGETVSKYYLLSKVKDVFELDVDINEDASVEQRQILKPSRVQKDVFEDLILPLSEQLLELKNFYAEK